jgi:hypothetical protein
MRAVVLNDPALRSALRGVYEGRETLTREEWAALLGLWRGLENSAARQRRRLLREVLGDTDLPLWAQWVVETTLKRREFSPEELESAIRAARERVDRGI